jgi:squalene cyclase
MEIWKNRDRNKSRNRRRKVIAMTRAQNDRSDVKGNLKAAENGHYELEVLTLIQKIF